MKMFTITKFIERNHQTKSCVCVTWKDNEIFNYYFVPFTLVPVGDKTFQTNMFFMSMLLRTILKLVKTKWNTIMRDRSPKAKFRRNGETGSSFYTMPHKS